METMPKRDKAVEWYYSQTEEHHIILKNRIDWIVDNIKGDTLLDIGTAGGLIPILAQDKKVIGIDIYEEMIAQAKQANNEIEFIVADASTFQCDKVDCITAGQVLEHVKDDKAVIDNCYKLLNPNGRIIITVPYKGIISNEHLRLYDEDSLLMLLNDFQTHSIKVVDDRIFYIGDKVC